MPEVFPARYWHDKAEEARLLAEQMTGAETHYAMLAVARNYDKLAQYSDKMRAVAEKAGQ